MPHFEGGKPNRVSFWETACIELTRGAAAAQSVRIVPVLAKVFEPWKLKGTSLSPMAASLIVLCATVPARQTELNRSHSRDNSVTRVRYVVGSDRTTGQKQYPKPTKPCGGHVIRRDMNTSSQVKDAGQHRTRYCP